MTAWFASTMSPPSPKRPPPRSSWAVRVTVRSVPIPASGSSVALCASSSPFERLEIAITSADPEGEAEQGEDRPAATAQELGAEVAEVEHGRIETRARENGLSAR